jgi:hypothetical protein
MGRDGRAQSLPFGLLGLDADDADFGVGPVPVLGYGVKDEPEIPLVAGLERRGRDRFHVNVRLPHSDQLERLGLVLRHFVGWIAKEHLDGHAGDGAAPGVYDLAVEIGDFAARQVGRFAHRQLADGQVGGIGVEGRGDRGDLGRCPGVLEVNCQPTDNGQHNNGCNRHGQPITLRRRFRTNELRTCAHERDCTPDGPQRVIAASDEFENGR